MGRLDRPLDPQEVMQRVNARVAGFRAYFGLRGEDALAAQLEALDARLQQMADKLLPQHLLDTVWRRRERFSWRQAPPPLDHDFPATRAYPPGGQRSPTPPGLGTSTTTAETAPAVTRPGDLDELGIIDTRDRVVVTRDGCHIGVSGGRLAIKARRRTLHERPLDSLALLLLQGRFASISTDLQARLARADVPVILAPSAGPPVAVVHPVRSGNARLRAQQVIRRDAREVMQAGLDMVGSKVGNQAAVLRYFGKYRKKTAPALAGLLGERAAALREVAKLLLPALDHSTPTLRAVAMGHEGRAASIYWSGVSELVPGTHGFPGRRTRDAKDALNCCLNYTYGLLYGEVWRAVAGAGLDPYFGILHGAERDQGSLVFDLIEELRAPFADRVVVAMIGRGFHPRLRNGRLDRRTCAALARAFYKAFNRRVRWRTGKKAPAEILAHQVDAYVRLVSEGTPYRPFKMRW